MGAIGWEFGLMKRVLPKLLDGHDMNTISLHGQKEPDETGHCLHFAMRSRDWNPDKGEAFLDFNHFDENTPVSDHVKEIKKLYLQEFNLLARGAQAIVEKEGLKQAWFQPWFAVLSNPNQKDQYKTSQLRLEQKLAEERAKDPDEIKKNEEGKKAAEAKRAEEAKKVVAAKQAEEVKKAEEARKAREIRRIAEEARKVEADRLKAEEAIRNARATSPLGSLKTLPPRVFTHIIGMLLPFERNKIKAVSSEFCKIASDESFLNEPEYAIARQNLELMRPHFDSLINYAETVTENVTMHLYLDSKGKLQAYKGVCTEKYRLPNVQHHEIQECNKISLHWDQQLRRRGNDRGDKYGRGVMTYRREPFKSDFFNKIAEHTITLANQLFDGANEIARSEGKMYRGATGMGTEIRPEWEIVFKDPTTYPMDQVLEAAKNVKHLPKL